MGRLRLNGGMFIYNLFLNYDVKLHFPQFCLNFFYLKEDIEFRMCTTVPCFKGAHKFYLVNFLTLHFFVEFLWICAQHKHLKKAQTTTTQLL